MKVEIFFLVVGLFIGFFIIYTTSSNPQIVIKYPTLDNIQTTTFVDDKGRCYKYFAQEVDCLKYKQPLNSK